MLSSPGFGHQFLAFHATREQRLADGVVELMGAGVDQVLALEVDLCTATVFRQTSTKIERSGPSYVIREIAFQVPSKSWVAPSLLVGLGDFEQRGHQGFGDEYPAEGAEVRGGDGLGLGFFGCHVSRHSGQPHCGQPHCGQPRGRRQ